MVVVVRGAAEQIGLSAITSYLLLLEVEILLATSECCVKPAMTDYTGAEGA